MKNKKIITLLLLIFTFLLPISTLRANDEIDTTRTAYIYSRTAAHYVPVEFVKDSEMPTYLLDGEETLDFRRHFHIIDQGTDVLNMRKQVDGAISIIDLGGYTWDLGGFDISQVGNYTITINYIGANGVPASGANKVNVKVIEVDDVKPAVSAVIGNRINVNVGSTFMSAVASIRVIDNVDGLIELTEENFSGHENIENSPLNSEHQVTLTVKDAAGNEQVVRYTARLVDNAAPVIHNVINIETKKGVVVDYKSHLRFTDNYTTADKIVVEYAIVTDSAGTEVTGEDEIDFSKVGETYIRVTARDEGGREAYRVYRVIIKDSQSLGMIILYLNLGLIGVAGVSIGGIILYKKLRKKPQ